MGGFYSITFVGVIIPIVIIGFFLIKYKVKMRVAVIGLLTFFISQVLIRLPILQFVQMNFANSTESLAYKILVPFSAGLVEVLADYLAFKYFMKKINRKDAAVLGLGHALCENIVLVLIPIVIQVMTTGNNSILYSISYIGSFERTFATLAHVTFAFFAYYAVKEKKISYLIYGILLHGFSDLPILFIKNVGTNEMLFAIIAIVSFIIILRVMSLNDKNNKVYLNNI